MDLERDRPSGETLDKTEILDERSLYIGNDVIKEIESRLRFLALVGLDYLTMDRRANTLSGGESQRIRLTTQIGTRLTGVMYVLDEPSIGLHPRDNSRLLDTLRELTDLGNTLIVVEHDESTLMQADWLVDLGPGAGKEGGEVIVSGQIDDLIDNSRSETGAYLSEGRPYPFRTSERPPRRMACGEERETEQPPESRRRLSPWLHDCGDRGFREWEVLARDRDSRPCAPQVTASIGHDPGRHDGIEGMEHVDKAIVIDQSP